MWRHRHHPQQMVTISTSSGCVDVLLLAEMVPVISNAAVAEI